MREDNKCIFNKVCPLNFCDYSSSLCMFACKFCEKEGSCCDNYRCVIYPQEVFILKDSKDE